MKLSQRVISMIDDKSAKGQWMQGFRNHGYLVQRCTSIGLGNLLSLSACETLRNTTSRSALLYIQNINSVTMKNCTI